MDGDVAGGDEAGADATAAALSVGDEIELEIGPVGHGGICVARVGGGRGRVVFVRYALPGERALVRITEVRRGSYCRGEAVTILRADPRRVPPPCRHFGPGGCGGCDFQHAAADLQRELKAAVVAEQLRRLAGLAWPVVVEQLPGSGFGWRTRVRWAVGTGGDGVADAAGDGAADGGPAGGGAGAAGGAGRDVIVGPRRYRSHEVVPVDPAAPCLIAAPGLTEAAAALRPPPGADQVVLTRTGDGPAAVTWLRRGGGRIRRGGGPAMPHSSARLRSRKGPPAGKSGLPASDSGYLGGAQDGGGVAERAAGRAFAVGATGFWQAHAHAADVLCDAVTDALADLDLIGAAAWDLYGGVGLFAAVLADLVGSGGSVTSVERDREASALAARNLRDLPQARAVRARVDAALTSPNPSFGLAGPVDAVVLDPPRSGAGPRVGTAIAERGPAVIVYVACDPAALARDTAALIGAGYRLDSLRAFDAFPQTQHVECVARFVPA